MDVGQRGRHVADAKRRHRIPVSPREVGRGSEKDPRAIDHVVGARLAKGDAGGFHIVPYTAAAVFRRFEARKRPKLKKITAPIPAPMAWPRISFDVA